MLHQNASLTRQGIHLRSTQIRVSSAIGQVYSRRWAGAAMAAAKMVATAEQDIVVWTPVFDEFTTRRGVLIRVQSLQVCAHADPPGRGLLWPLGRPLPTRD
jgi:hypothetical protein